MSIFSRLAVKKAKSTIHNLVEEKRLIFRSAEQVSYTDKEGKVTEMNLDAMARLVVDKVGRDNLLSVGIIDITIKDMIVAEFNKQSRVKT